MLFIFRIYTIKQLEKIRDVNNLIVEYTLILTIVNFLFSDQGFLV